MNEDVLQNNFWKAGSSGKNNDLAKKAGVVGTFGIGFRKDDQKLRDDVQKVINEMKKDGTMAKISEKWFGKDITKK